MDITKANGDRELFSKTKLCASLERSGAPLALAEAVCQKVSATIGPDVTTTDIFRAALSYLIDEDLTLAAVYSLRRGVSSLGPAGFLFEHYLEVVLRAYGYTTKRNQIIQGTCITHEIDLTAQKDTTHFIIEAKYHNEYGIRTHVPTVMYAYARLLDIAEREVKNETQSYSHKMWVITNTKFTDTATKYAVCRDVKLTGWDYPKGESLEDIIINKKLFPITVLPALTEAARDTFAKVNIILVQDLLLYSSSELSARFGIPLDNAEILSQQVGSLLKK